MHLRFVVRLQHVAGGVRHLAAVVGGQVSQRRQGGLRAAEVVAAKQDPEISDGLEAQARQLAADPLLDFRRQRGTLRERILREDDLALLSIRPLVGRLPRRAVDDLLAHVVVELVDRDGAVIVSIRGACLQAFDQKVREQGVRRIADDLIAVPCVLRGVGGGQDHPAQPCPLERFRGPDADALRGLGPVGKRAAVAAIEDEDLTSRSCDPCGR